MKRKLLITYVLVLLSFLLPSSLEKTTHESPVAVKRQEILKPVEAANLGTFETVATVPVSPQDYVKSEAVKYGWNEGYQWNALYTLISNESGWNHLVYNSSSQACGLFQALPCSKLGAPLENVSNQAKWGLAYISNRYRTPANALSQWQGRYPHWY